jgi:hypothetical protein
MGTYPAPIACPYHELTRHEPGAGAFGCLMDTFEALVHFLAMVAVSAYARSGSGRPECNRLLAERFLKGKWATGDYMGLLRDVIQHAGGCDGHLPYADLPSYLFRKDKPTASAKALDGLVNLRNSKWGHGTGRTDDSLAAALKENRPRLEAELARMGWLASWQLVRPLEIDEDGTVTQARCLMGTRRDRDFDGPLTIEPEDMEGGRVRPQTSLLLVSPGGDRYLPLFPLALFLATADRSSSVYLCQGCEASADDGTVQVKRADYVAYEAGLPKHRERGDDAAGRMLQELIQGLLPSAAPSPAPAPRTDAPRQIPAPPADFVGRDDVFTRLDGQVAGGMTISGIHGLGGVGKTTLALKLAERLGPRYPDGHIYFDLKGVDPKPLTWQEAMAHVLHAFHPEARLPVGDAELAGRYRSVLTGRRVLLLWDNAAGKEQVEPLLPPDRGSLVLVTSRRRFHLPGLSVFDLDALPPADAVKLLRSIAPQLDESMASAIAKRCGNLPLALRLAGATLAERDDFSPQKYLGRLQAARLKELDGVSASLRLSEEIVPEPLRSKWRELVVLVGNFKAEWATEVWGTDEATADDYLGTLRRGSLLGWDGKAGLYRMHDLVWDFASERVSAAARADAARRHARLFCELIGGEGSSKRSGAAGLEQTGLWANARAGFLWARGRPKEDKDATCLSYGYGTHESYPEVLPFPGVSVDIIMRGAAPDPRRQLEFNIACDDKRATYDTVGFLGGLVATWDRHLLPQAIQMLETALAGFRAMDDRVGEAITSRNLVKLLVKQHRLAEAVQLMETCRRFEQEIGYPDADKCAAYVEQLRQRLAGG